MTQFFVAAPSLALPASQICTASQFAEDEFFRLIEVIKQQPRLHRKQWEYAYILRVLELNDMIRPGRSALGIGCGSEPLAAVMAGAGVEVTGTEIPSFRPGGEDREPLSAMDIFYGGICSEDVFRRQVSFRLLDLLAMPSDLGQYDVLWACSVLEELGTVGAGLDAAVSCARLLRSGGIAVFTTQLLLSHDVATIERPGLAVWRRLDMLDLQSRIIDVGCEMLPICMTTGSLPEDAIVDEPPYVNPVHLKMQIDGETITSVGFAFRKA